MRKVDSSITFYGALKRTDSSQGLSHLMGARAKSLSSMRTDSFSDLPLIAVAGLASRVSIKGSTSEPHELEALFRDGPNRQVPYIKHEGGWTRSLVLSTAGALLSALQFGINNGNMNTQALVMRDALGIPSRLPIGCVGPSALPANDALWGFCISVFCLSALLGTHASGCLADRHGRRSFLLLNSLVYIAAGLIEFASSWPDCAHASTHRAADFCDPQPCATGIGVLLVGRVVTGVACGGEGAGAGRHGGGVGRGGMGETVSVGPEGLSRYGRVGCGGAA